MPDENGSADQRAGRARLRYYASLRAKSGPQTCHACQEPIRPSALTDLWERAFYTLFNHKPDATFADLEGLSITIVCGTCYARGDCPCCQEQAGRN